MFLGNERFKRQIEKLAGRRASPRQILLTRRVFEQAYDELRNLAVVAPH